MELWKWFWKCKEKLKPENIQDDDDDAIDDVWSNILTGSDLEGQSSNRNSNHDSGVEKKQGMEKGKRRSKYCEKEAPFE